MHIVSQTQSTSVDMSVSVQHRHNILFMPRGNKSVYWVLHDLCTVILVFAANPLVLSILKLLVNSNEFKIKISFPHYKAIWQVFYEIPLGSIMATFHVSDTFRTPDDNIW